MKTRKDEKARTNGEKGLRSKKKTVEKVRKAPFSNREMFEGQKITFFQKRQKTILKIEAG